MKIRIAFFCVICVAPLLSGCIAAAVPLALEGVKLVQNSTGGGTMHVSFVGPDGKELPAASLPSFRRVAIWPQDQGEVMLANKLASQFEVTSPAQVGAILDGAKIPHAFKDLTAAEQSQGFQLVCKTAPTEVVVAATAQGQKANTNVFSLSRANITLSANIVTYSCVRASVAESVQMIMVVDLGAKTPSTGEINDAASTAWAERIVQMKGSDVSGPMAMGN